MQTTNPPDSVRPYPSDALFNRSARLLGASGMARLDQARVILFGVGGVGSWCAESLVRTGIGSLTLVDSDRVCVTNCNRQLQATCRTVGQVKVSAMRERLLDINPQAEVSALQGVYHADTADGFDLDAYDVVVDAIDSISSKILLLYRASQSRAAVFCSLGAALKVDPSRIRTAAFHDVKGCPLGSKLRKQMRRDGMLPLKPIPTVFSDEVLPNLGLNAACGSDACLCPRATQGPGDPSLLNHEWCSRKAVINGSLAHITGIFGLMLAGLIVQHLTSAAETGC